MGNRLLGLLSAILYSRLAGRQLVVDWSDPLYSREGENVFPLLFAAPVSALTLGDLRGWSIAPEDWSGRLEASVGQQRERIDNLNLKTESERLCADPGRMDYPEQVVVFWSRFERIQEMRAHFRGEFRHLAAKSNEQILCDLLRTEVVLHPEIAAQVDRFRRRAFVGEVVGVHIRNSDLSFSAQKTFRSVDKIVAGHPSCKVFLATDSIETLHQACERYGADRLLATEKWFPAPGQPIHLTAEPASRLATAREALADLYLLAACDWLVGDWRSSFGYVASLLFEGERSRVRNCDPGRFVPRHVGHRLGIWRQVLRHDIKRWTRGRNLDPPR